MNMEIKGIATSDAEPVADPLPDRKPGSPSLSVIIPFRDEGIAPWFIPRLEELCRSLPRTDQLEFIVVDSGSTNSAREQARLICEQTGVAYLFHDSAGQAFSLGAARDFGARYATKRSITFFDVDLRVPSDFWDRLLSLMTVYGISSYKKRFFAVPALYLTEEGTAEFQATESENKFADFHLRWLHGDGETVQAMAPCSSVGIIDRIHYLSIGGHNPAFRGHGFEDFELYHRLLGEEDRIPKSDNYLKETKSWETATYNGFRSRLALIGRPALLSNLFVVHLWHPRPKSLSFYNAKKMKAAREIWVDVFNEFDKTKNHPTPLLSANTEQKKILFFGNAGTNAARCLREAWPHLGIPVFVSEHDFVEADGRFMADEFQSLLRNNRIESVVFPNPYGNDARLNAYEWCRKTKFPFVVFDRGAFPDSWFFDPNGFNADSKSYDRANWDFPLSDKERTATLQEIQRLTQGSDTLELQGEFTDSQALSEKLGVGGKRVLFVPLQRPSDTVTKHMAGQIGSCERFLSVIDETALHLKRKGWVVLCKKHPLETTTPPLRHARYVPEDTNFISLLELSESVALINSGVGVYSMIMGKPCFIFGDAFYEFEGVNRPVTLLDPKTISEEISTGFSVNMETVFKFIHYLNERFYSFGTPTTERKPEADGSLRTLTTAIDYYDLKLPGAPRVLYKKETWTKLSTLAPIFERYKLDLVQKSKTGREALNRKGSAAPNSIVQSTPVRASRLSATDRRKARLAKLRRDPYAFFRDAQVPQLRPLRYLFKF